VRFAAIDFETATEKRSSACAVGAVLFEVDDTTGVWQFSPEGVFYELVRPPNNSFWHLTIDIHGITPDMTADADPFDRVWSRLEERLDGHTLIAHNAAFDISVLRNAADLCDFAPKPFEFLCTYRLAKSTFPTMFSYRLDVLAEHFEIELPAHHHAAWDAAAAAQLASRICEGNGVQDPVSASLAQGFRLGYFRDGEYGPFSNAAASAPHGRGEHIRFRDLVPTGDVDESHPVYGLSFAFTGTLTSMSRKEAAQLVIDCGGEAHAGPTRTTNFLVVGITDFSKVRDGMSGKMKKARDLADSGTGIEIIDEAEFLRLFSAGSGSQESG
jgi:DNA polymerase-3 subunit epsilon